MNIVHWQPGKSLKKLDERRENLACKLTPEEFRNRAMKLASIENSLAAHKIHVEQVKAELKSKEGRLLDERNKLSTIVAAEQEPRDVVVQEWADFDRNVVETVRLDSMEVVASRALTYEEVMAHAQQELPLAEEQAPAAEQAPAEGTQEVALSPGEVAALTPKTDESAPLAASLLAERQRAEAIDAANGAVSLATPPDADRTGTVPGTLEGGKPLTPEERREARKAKKGLILDVAPGETEEQPRARAEAGE